MTSPHNFHSPSPHNFFVQSAHNFRGGGCPFVTFDQVGYTDFADPDKPATSGTKDAPFGSLAVDPRLIRDLFYRFEKPIDKFEIGLFTGLAGGDTFVEGTGFASTAFVSFEFIKNSDLDLDNVTHNNKLDLNYDVAFFQVTLDVASNISESSIRKSDIATPWNLALLGETLAETVFGCRILFTISAFSDTTAGSKAWPRVEIYP